MEFFDEALVKAKEVLAVAGKKATEVVNTGKQKFDIASLEAKREKDYAALGRMYFEIARDSQQIDQETRKIVEEIARKNELIASLKADIADRKDKETCPSCAAEVDKKSAYCSNCGEKLPVE